MYICQQDRLLLLAEHASAAECSLAQRFNVSLGPCKVLMWALKLVLPEMICACD
jgi:hypothetical protein